MPLRCAIAMSSRSMPTLATFSRRVERVLRRAVARLAVGTVPRLYLLYMRGVFATSRVRWNDFPRIHDVIRKHDGAVALLWHEEVFTVAYGYARAGLRPHTLASLGDSGEVITRMLELCGFVVFRGGSSPKRSRRRVQVLRDMVDHMRSHPEVLYGITVDGSSGPPYRMKGGGLLLARACRKPIVLIRTWYRRRIRLPTWDRMAVPLPFNEIAYYIEGPYDVPDARNARGLRHFALGLEDDLIDLAARSYRELGQRPPSNLAKRASAEREGAELVLES